MKKLIVFMGVICSLLVLSGCFHDSKPKIKTVRMGDKINKKLEKDDYGFYKQGHALLSTDDNDRVVSIKFPFKRDYVPVHDATAMSNYKEVTNDDLDYVTGTTYHSDKLNRDYTIEESRDSDGKIVSASIFFKDFDPTNPEKFYNK